MSDVDDGPQHPYVARFARDGRLELTSSPVKSIDVAIFGGVFGAVILWANVGRFADALAGRTSGGALAGVLFVGAIVLFLLGGAVVSIVGLLRRQAVLLTREGIQVGKGSTSQPGASSVRQTHRH